MRIIVQLCEAQPKPIKMRAGKLTVLLVSDESSPKQARTGLLNLPGLPLELDRFVLIGLCWLYGRSEFSPPPPP